MTDNFKDGAREVLGYTDLVTIAEGETVKQLSDLHDELVTQALLRQLDDLKVFVDQKVPVGFSTDRILDEIMVRKAVIAGIDKLPVISREDYEANKSVGWYIKGRFVMQLVRHFPREVRIVGVRAIKTDALDAK